MFDRYYIIGVSSVTDILNRCARVPAGARPGCRQSLPIVTPMGGKERPMRRGPKPAKSKVGDLERERETAAPEKRGH